MISRDIFHVFKFWTIRNWKSFCELYLSFQMLLQKNFCSIKEYERSPICFLKDFQIALAICNASQLWSTTSHAYIYLLCYMYRYYLRRTLHDRVLSKFGFQVGKFNKVKLWYLSSLIWNLFIAFHQNFWRGRNVF